MQVNGKAVIERDMEDNIGMMGLNMKKNGKTTIKMVLED